MDNAGYRKIFKDIVLGYSAVKFDQDTLYIKHLSAIDQVDIDQIQDQYFSDAINRGIETEKESLERLIKEGSWSEKDDKEIVTQENFLDSLRQSKTQIVLKSQIDKQNKLIDSTISKINQLKEKKKSLIGLTAESYSEKRANDYYVIKSFFHDSKLKSPVFPGEKDFGELYQDEVTKFVSVYNETFQMFEELKIQEMILQDFYYIYFPFSDDTVGFFGNPVCHLTYNQLKLIVYTKIFKNIFEQNSHIPEKIKKDPKALLDYGSITEEAKSKMKDQLDMSKDGATLFGATNEDYEYAGLEKPQDSSRISLQKAAEQKGGKLSMEDLMELSGYNKK